MARITRKMIETRFNTFAKLMDMEITHIPFGQANVGKLYLDHQSVYGGYCIRLVDNESGGVSCPFGDIRYSARQFFDMLCFANAALYKKGKS